MSENTIIEFFKSLPAILTALGAVIAAIASVVSVIVSRGNRRKVEHATHAIQAVDHKADVIATRVERVNVAVAEVKTEVKTGNAQSLAQLADKAESRRIADIPAGERTLQEVSHVHSLSQSEDAAAKVELEQAVTKERDRQAAAGKITKTPSEEGVAQENKENQR